jgi:hypothetical protein
MMDGGPAGLLLAPFEQRRLEHPAERPLPFRDEPEPVREPAPQPVERDGGPAGVVGDDEDEVAVLGAGGLGDLRELVGRQVLLDRRAEPPVLVGDPHEPRSPAALRLGDELVELLA